MNPATITAGRYSGVAIVLHWTIAALIAANLALGLKSASLKGLAQFELIQWHKSLGITILVLSLARLGWRLMKPSPPQPWDAPSWQQGAAVVVHWAFYGLMLGLPVSGWVMVSASPMNIPTLLYKRLPWPHLPFIHDLTLPARRQIEAVADQVHLSMTYAAYALIILHVLAVAKHHWIDRDDTLFRMAPLARFAPRRRRKL